VLVYLIVGVLSQSGCERVHYRLFDFTESEQRILERDATVRANLYGSWQLNDSSGIVRESMTTPYGLWLGIDGLSPGAEVSFVDVTLTAVGSDSSVSIPFREARWQADSSLVWSTAWDLAVPYEDQVVAGSVVIRNTTSDGSWPFEIRLNRNYAEFSRNRFLDRLRG